MSGFNEHKLMLFLNAELYDGFIKMQADRHQGRAYAGLSAFIEGLYHMGYISKEVYELSMQRYSEPLNQKKPTREDIFAKQDLTQADKTIKSMIEQFEFHKQNEGWLKSARRYAESHGELDSAKMLLGMIEKASAVTVATVRENPDSLSDSEKAAQLREDLRGQSSSYREVE